MYAVIASGGKQEKVAQGEKVQVELLGIADGEEVRFAPVLFVDGDTVLATPDQLKGVSVVGRVIGTTAGPKIDGFTFTSSSSWNTGNSLLPAIASTPPPHTYIHIANVTVGRDHRPLLRHRRFLHY